MGGSMTTIWAMQSVRGSVWFHCLSTSLIATVAVTVSRMIGSGAQNGDALQLALHSLVIVACINPFQNLFAVSLMKGLGQHLPMWVPAVAGCTLAAFPATFLSPSINWILGLMPTPNGPVETRAEFFDDVQSRVGFIFFAFALCGTLLWMVLSFPWWQRRLMRQWADERGATDKSPALAPDISGLLLKLPHQKRGAIRALSAEQHYTRVYTDAGNDLVLMPFSEAIASASDIEGMRIHRSHWVAGNAVRAVEETPSGYLIEIADGTKLPVSRSFRGAVREVFSSFF